MKLINSSFKICEQKPGIEGVYEQIEMAGRICYKSTRPEGQTALNFVDKLIFMGHNAILEHGTIYLKIPQDKVDIISKYQYNPYSKVFYHECDFAYITTNYRVLIENYWTDDLDYLCEPTKYHQKRITVHFICNRAIANEFVRHRAFSFAQESTRFCNYSKKKFGSDITFICPSWIENAPEEITPDRESCLLAGQYDRKNKTERFLASLVESKDAYLTLLDNGCTPQEARDVLHLALKTELIMTGFKDDWEYFFRLRSSKIAETGMPHPDASILVDDLAIQFLKRYGNTSNNTNN